MNKRTTLLVILGIVLTVLAVSFTTNLVIKTAAGFTGIACVFALAEYKIKPFLGGRR